MAELVDAQDLKSCEGHTSCRFKSGLRHHFGEIYLHFNVSFFIKNILLYLKSNKKLKNFIKYIVLNNFICYNYTRINSSDTKIQMEKYPSLVEGTGLENREVGDGAGVRIPLSPPFIYIAEWSSLVARRAHNPKVVGSNPSSATILVPWCSGYHVCLSRRRSRVRFSSEPPLWLCSSVGRARD